MLPVSLPRRTVIYPLYFLKDTKQRDRKIAWSRLGPVAYISHDAQRILLRNLACRPGNGQWGLGDEKSHSQVAEAQGGHVFTHLCWNEAGSDLAAVDSCGRILTLSMSVALNAFTLSRTAIIDPDDDGNQPVGLVWLGINRPVSASGTNRLLISFTCPMLKDAPRYIRFTEPPKQTAAGHTPGMLVGP